MTDIIIQPNADADDVLTNAVVINDATLPLSNQDAVSLGLTLGTTYKARVLGTPQTFSVSDVPAQMAAPTLSVSGTTITVAMAADPANNGEAITSNDIRYSTDQVNWTIVDAATDPYNITSLDASTLYYVQTRAININGEGEWSTSATETTGIFSADVYFVGSATGEAFEGTTTTINLPVGAQEGDYLVITIACDDLLPAGIVTGATLLENATTGQVGLAAYGKFVGASDTNVELNMSGTQFRHGSVVIGAYRSVSQVAPISVSAVVVTGESNATTIADVSPTASGEMLVLCSAVDDKPFSNGGDFATPAGFTEAGRADNSKASGENAQSKQLYQATTGTSAISIGSIFSGDSEATAAITFVLGKA